LETERELGGRIQQMEAVIEECFQNLVRWRYGSSLDREVFPQPPSAEWQTRMWNYDHRM
jgi:hypothetical protein